MTVNIHKIQKFAEPGLRLCLVLMAAFAVATWFFNPTLAYAEAGVIAALIVYSIIRERARRRENGGACTGGPAAGPGPGRRIRGRIAQPDG